MVRMTSSGARSPAWKSTECPIDPWLTRVTTKVSPTRPCSVGPGDRAVEGPPLLPHPGRHLQLDLLDRQRHGVGVCLADRGRAAGTAAKPAPGVPVRSSGASSPDAVAAPDAVAGSTRGARRRAAADDHVEHHPHRVTDDAAPALGARAQHTDVQGGRPARITRPVRVPLSKVRSCGEPSSRLTRSMTRRSP